MTLRVVYSPRARDQLTDLYDYIAHAAAAPSAERVISAIIDYCDDLADFPLRGVARDDLRVGLRVLGFRRRVAMAFAVRETTIEVIGVFYGGRDYEAILQDGGALGE